MEKTSTSKQKRVAIDDSVRHFSMSQPNSNLQSPETSTRKRIIQRILKKEGKAETLTPYFSQSPEINPRKRQLRDYEITQAFTEQNETLLQSYNFDPMGSKSNLTKVAGLLPDEGMLNINQRSLSPDTLRKELIASLQDRIDDEQRLTASNHTKTDKLFLKVRKLISQSCLDEASAVVRTITWDLTSTQQECLGELKRAIKKHAVAVHEPIQPIEDPSEKQLRILISTFNPLYIKVRFTQQLKSSSRKNTEIKELLHILYRLSRRVNSGKAFPSNFPSTWKDVEIWLSQPGVIVNFLRQLPSYLEADKLSSSKS